ncbi:hypothetical protein B296_00055341 [Ensete ventricosum]|uniref:Uncharacterized protein n=1 Tax=Ensete ventricosum TaxID=4639 RepID=A0A426Y073_ENSVE|nr:hypothetical protein B296_00055341 [Ensete ventricosum]
MKPLLLGETRASHRVEPDSLLDSFQGSPEKESKQGRLLDIRSSIKGERRDISQDPQPAHGSAPRNPIFVNNKAKQIVVKAKDGRWQRFVPAILDPRLHPHSSTQRCGRTTRQQSLLTALSADSSGA